MLQLSDMAEKVSDQGTITHDRHFGKLDHASFLKLCSFICGYVQVIPDLLSYITFGKYSIADTWLHFSLTSSLFMTYSIVDHLSLAQEPMASITFNLSQCVGWCLATGGRCWQ
jgi:hypothetical protein